MRLFQPDLSARLRVASRLAVTLLGLASIAGCYSPTLAPGQQACTADGKCPEGMSCFGDKRCYPTGSSPTCDPKCGGATPVCDTTRLKCVGCISDGNCSGDTTVCDKSSSTCVQCLDDTTCPTGFVCAVALKTCKPGCSAGHQGCVPDAGACDVDMGVCRGCSGDKECSAPSPRCNVSSGHCVQCLVQNDNCPADQYCEAQQCKQGCKNDASCAAPDGGGSVACCAHSCANLDTDVNNCGACGKACAMGEACCAGTCKALSTDVLNCGACGMACKPQNATAPTCAKGACGYAACAGNFGDCDLVAMNGCEVDLQSDSANCGGCGMACAVPPNGSAACMAGACKITGCKAGFGDCDRNIVNGCEVQLTVDVRNCGACGIVCPAVANGVAICLPGMVGATCGGNCNNGFANCDNNLGNGCEVNTTSNPAHCGGCGRVCALPNAVAGCANSACTVASCNAGFADCDGNPANGCEVNITNSPGNCGRCGTVCSVANGVAGCANSACTVASCNNGFGNCDNNPANGCEVNLTNSVGNCGVCGKVCGSANAVASCVNSACNVACNAGWGNCNADASDGCESNLGFDARNCAGCGRACAAGQTCTKSACAVASPVMAAGTYGPQHTFAGLTTDHYITQGSCSINNQVDADDAWYFCTHFYGPNCYVQPGFVKQATPVPAYAKMHKQGGCTSNGSDIAGRVCDAGACKIGNWAETTNGIANLICRCN